jgi:hypothetical protein
MESTYQYQMLQIVGCKPSFVNNFLREPAFLTQIITCMESNFRVHVSQAMMSGNQTFPFPATQSILRRTPFRM